MRYESFIERKPITAAQEIKLSKIASISAAILHYKTRLTVTTQSVSPMPECLEETTR